MRGLKEHPFPSVSSRNTVGLGEVGTGSTVKVPVVGSSGDSGILRLQGLP